MAKQIVVLEKLGKARFLVAFWAAPPAARVKFYAGRQEKSAWIDATPAEHDAIKTGTIVESVEQVALEEEPSIPAFQALLLERWTAYNATIQSTNPWNRYGTFYENGVWTPAGVP